MEFADLQANFPPGVPVPDKLVKLLEFANRSRNWYSGHFQLEKWPYPDAAWFDGDVEAAKQFAGFGRESDGSAYAYWLYAGVNIATAPIVFLGSEGTYCNVVAGSLEDFLALLALSDDCLGFATSRDYFVKYDGSVPRLAEFREWLRQVYGIVAPADPMSVVRNARAKQPDLQEFVHAWQEKHFGKG